ncbi:uncharacterized protein LOC129718563 [Wyeomyia smithii]|uniref:uncharacterized protein LOC129718563 n=1 Tax=Wyeomyia smithii TaxID=174621 RepID=UPI002467FCB8|nr:uncharacterized protein LOC129718563 [Wyeomyia smithii]XP_055525418.1 uncharacterized protein LOC129718563 [Wyeomyia smithii]XP_055525419.1 uncharacterized protein LOC129718563 [Wyeomyia smithii]
MSDGHQVALDQREDFFEYEYLDELTILRGDDEYVVYESYLVDNTLEDRRSSYEVDLCEPIVEGNSALHDDFINYPMEELPIPSETNPVVILEITPTTLEEIDVEEISNLDNFDQICEVSPSSGNDEENIQSLNFRYQYEQEKEMRKLLELEVRQLKLDLRISKRTSARRAQTVRKSKETIRMYKRCIKTLRQNTMTDNKLLNKLKQNPVLYNSLGNLGFTPKKRRYNQHAKKFALSTYLCGPRVYRMIQLSKVLCLPSKRTIKRWTQAVKMRPGLNQIILQRMKSEVECWSRLERIVVIAIDGMKIKSSLSYSAKNDFCYGFPDSGYERKVEKNNPQQLASEAVVVMVRGLYKKFKQGLGYFLTQHFGSR